MKPFLYLQANGDLKQKILEHMRRPDVTVNSVWTKAHRTDAEAEDEDDLLRIHINRMADTAAGKAHELWPASVSILQEMAVRRSHRKRLLMAMVIRRHIDRGIQITKGSVQELDPMEVPEGLSLTEAREVKIPQSGSLNQSFSMGAAAFMSLLLWLRKLQWFAPVAPVRGTSSLELLALMSIECMPCIPTVRMNGNQLLISFQDPVACRDAARLLFRGLQEMSVLLGSLVVPGLDVAFGSKLYQHPYVEGRWPHVPAMLPLSQRQQVQSLLQAHFNQESAQDSVFTSQLPVPNALAQFRKPKRISLSNVQELQVVWKS